MPDTPQSISTGPNSMDSIYAMELDTKQRFENALSRIQKPIDYPIPDFNKDFFPRGLPQNDLFDESKVRGSLGQGLFSNDTRIADSAAKRVRGMQDNTLTGKGVGVPDRHLYDPSQDKYLKGDFGYNPYISLQENEQFNYEHDYLNQGMFERTFKNLGVGVTRFLGGVVAKLGQTVGYVGSMVGNAFQEVIDPKGNNFMADVADNSLSRWFEGLETDMKNSNTLSVFKPANWDDQGFFNKLTQGAFWTDEISDGAAFMGEMIASMYLLGGLGRAAGLTRLGATPLAFGERMFGSAGKVIDYTTKFVTGSSDLSGVGRWAFSTASESAFEASQQYKQKQDDLKRGRDNGENNYTDEEIKQIAGNTAAASYKMNMLILSASNAFENRFIFEPIFGKAASLRPGSKVMSKLIDVSRSTESLDDIARASRRSYNYKNWLGRKLDWKNPNSRLRFYGSRSLSAAGMEGFWEENSQLAVERLTTGEHFADKGFLDQAGEVLSKTKDQAIDAIRGDDPQAATNIGLGAVIGIGGTSIAGKVMGGEKLFTGERRQLEIDTQRRIDDYEKYRKEFLSFQDIYDKDDEGNLIVNDKKAFALAKGISQFATEQSASRDMQDPIFKKHLQDRSIASYVYAAKAAGIFDRAVARFENVEMIDPAKLKDLGFDPNSTIDPSDMTATIKEFGKLYEEAQATRKGTKTEEESNIEDNRIHTLYRASTTALSAQSLAADYIGEVFEAKDLNTAISSAVQEHNMLVLQLQQLQQSSSQISEDTDFYKDHFESEKKRIKKRIKEIKKSIGMEGLLGENLVMGKDGRFFHNSKYKEFLPSVEDNLEEARKRLIKQFETQQDRDYKTPVGIYNDIETRAQLRRADLLNTASQHTFLADKLKGKDNTEQYFKFREYIDNVRQKDEEEDSKKRHSVKEEEDGSFSVVTPEGTTDSKDYKTKQEAQDAAIQRDNDREEKEEVEEVVQEDGIEEAEIVPEVTPEPPAPVTATNTQQDVVPEDFTKKDIVIVDEEEVANSTRKEVDETKPITWEYPTITSKRDTIDISADTEQISANDYDTMRAEFIRKFVSDPTFEDRYKLFIIKDSFPEVYEGVKTDEGLPVVDTNTEGKLQFLNEPGEVIIVENIDGSRPTIGDFFGDSYKNISHLPVLFSFDNGMFFKEPLYSTRAKIRAEKQKETLEEAKKVHRDTAAIAEKARKIVNNDPTAKVPVSIYSSTDGINPHTSPSTVQDRFGKDFTFEISVPSAKGSKETNTGYAPGLVVVKLQNGTRFPVYTTFLTNYSDLFGKVVDTLEYKFDDESKARDVRENFLNIIVNTNKEQFFTIDKEGEFFKINFRKKSHPTDSSKNAPLANDKIGKARLNVSRSAMTEGYTEFNPSNGKLDFVTDEDYLNLIKPKLMTTLKRLLNRKGEVIVEPVNPHFSFLVYDERIPESLGETLESKQANNYKQWLAKIEDLKKQGFDKDKWLNNLLLEYKGNQITQVQYERIKEMIIEEQIKDLKMLLNRAIAAKNDKEATSLKDRIAALEKELGKEVTEPEKVEPNQIKVILTIGTSGSGKSTWIKSLPNKEKYTIISVDEMRIEFTGDINDKSKDKEIYKESANRAIQSVKDGKSVIFDTTNLTKEKRRPFIEAIRKSLSNVSIEYKLMPLNPELAKQRIKNDITTGANRANVSDSTIDKHVESYKQMLEDIKEENIKEFKIDSDINIESKKETQEKAKSVMDKYKNKEKQDIGKIINQTPITPDVYSATLNNQEFVYNPENNKLYIIQNGQMEEFNTSGSILGRLLEKFTVQYPYRESDAGNTGWSKLELIEPTGAKYIVYGPPTRMTNAEFIVNQIGIKIAKDAMQIGEENKNKLQEFLNRYC